MKRGLGAGLTQYSAMGAVQDFSVDSSTPAGFFKNFIYSSKFSHFNYQSNNYLIVSINHSHPLHLHTIVLVVGPYTLAKGEAH